MAPAVLLPKYLTEAIHIVLARMNFFFTKKLRIRFHFNKLKQNKTEVLDAQLQFFKTLFQPKKLLIFSYFSTITCENSLEAPHRGTSNKYPKHMFSWRSKYNIHLIPSLIWSYTDVCHIYVYTEIKKLVHILPS